PYVVIDDARCRAAMVIIGNGGDLRFDQHGRKLTVAGDFVIEQGGTCSFNQDKTTKLFVAGNFVNDGTFMATGYSVIFNGTGPQAISGTEPVQFYHLTVTNPNGITIDGTDVTAIGTLTPTDLSPTLVNGGTFNGNSALPIQLGGFSAPFVSIDCVRLEWFTLSETNNYGFEIQKSVDGFSSYDVIGFVAGHGTTVLPQQYAFTDSAVVPGAAYYRLKQIDLDGVNHSFSDVVMVTVPTPTGVETDASSPLEFVLHQNYPNPFNPSTEIAFSVSSSGRASLHVYTITGQQVATLFDGTATAGITYRVHFDAAHLSTGIYFYRLQTQGSSEVKRMMLAK
ncbi:MAG: T9SS type A sorting domain-containing protein, partial [Ignavibacteria bacterium]|nr:T9SS type A sorting domain-containing protein [Ignavibacteria bacterium]